VQWIIHAQVQTKNKALAIYRIVRDKRKTGIPVHHQLLKKLQLSLEGKRSLTTPSADGTYY